MITKLKTRIDWTAVTILTWLVIVFFGLLPTLLYLDFGVPYAEFYSSFWECATTFECEDPQRRW